MMKSLETDRLFLRAFEMNDAPSVQNLASTRELAETTSLPHPYTLQDAENWIANHPNMIKNWEAFPFAVTLKNDNKLVGTMTIRVNKVHNKGELAYWIGKDYWGKGYATEAGKRAIEFGFCDLDLNRVWARIMTKNRASGKVLENVGLKYEGTQRQDVLRWGNYEDMDLYGVRKDDYISCIKSK